MNKYTSKEVAFYLMEEYKKRFKEDLDELKLHKLMYFIFREYIIQKNEPLFEENFYGWKYGPVLKSIREEYKKNNFKNIKINNKLNLDLKNTIDIILNKFGKKNSWSLSNLIHGEQSWFNSRKGISEEENGDNEMLYEDIKKDAEYIKLRREFINERKK